MDCRQALQIFEFDGGDAGDSLAGVALTTSGGERFVLLQLLGRGLPLPSARCTRTCAGR